MHSLFTWTNETRKSMLPVCLLTIINDRINNFIRKISQGEEANQQHLSYSHPKHLSCVIYFLNTVCWFLLLPVLHDAPVIKGFGNGENPSSYNRIVADQFLNLVYKIVYVPVNLNGVIPCCFSIYAKVVPNTTAIALLAREKINIHAAKLFFVEDHSGLLWIVPYLRISLKTDC